MKTRRHLLFLPGVTVFLAMLAVLAGSLPAGALPPRDDSGGGGSSGGGGFDCLSDTKAYLSVSPAEIGLGDSATVTLQWSVRPATGCGGMTQSISGIGNVDRQGAMAVQITGGRSWSLSGRKGGASRELGRASVKVRLPPIVTLSSGSEVTEQDIAQFDARWMGEAERMKRLAEYETRLKNRQAWIAWGVFDEASAMVRMFELTKDTRYLDHLRAVNNVALQFRDDQHPGHEFPSGLPPLPDGQPRRNPICIDCATPIVDRLRGRVMPAWGSGILYTDYVINGGLNPIDAVTSGVYLYGLAVFARLVAEHPDSAKQAAYAADAMKFANAAVQTLGAFTPEWDPKQVGSFIEGPIRRPRRAPTDAECEAANRHAKAYVHLFDPENATGLSKMFDDRKDDCKKVRDYADKPLAHNEGGALVMSFIELWRALDSNFYRTSPLRIADGELSRTVIPFIVTRHQRYFFNRLHVAEGRYWWKYNDDVPDPGDPDIEDTSHANLDMRYVDTLRSGFDRLNAQVAGVGEPVALDDAMLRRFANTFVEKIAPPSEINLGGNLRGNVNGRATKPNSAGEVDQFNSTLDGWITLSVVQPAVFSLCRSVLLRTDSAGVQKYLGPGTHAALLAHKRFTPPPPTGPPRLCPIGQKCCELTPEGGCNLCVPNRTQCPDEDLALSP